MNVETPFILQLAYFLLCGALIALVYETLRILRAVIPHNSLATGIEDTLYIALCGPVLFGLSMEIGNGEFRLLYLVSAVVGAAVYFLTVGRLVRAIYLLLINVVKCILVFIGKKILKPLSGLLVFIAQKSAVPFVLIYQKSASAIKNKASHLKLKHKMSYNTIYNDERNEEFERKAPIKAKVKQT